MVYHTHKFIIVTFQECQAIKDIHMSFQAYWGKRSNLNPRGNTGNIIVDFFYGREYNPFFFKGDLKLLTFRMSMIGLTLLNVLLVLQSINVAGGKANTAVVAAAAFQVSQLHCAPPIQP